MSVTITWAVIAGLGLGLGLVTAIFSLPVLNRPRFVDRVSPALRSTGVGEGLFTSSGRPLVQIGAVGRIFIPLVKATIVRLDRFSIDVAALQRRLDQADSIVSPSEFRLQQLMMGAAGAVLGAAVNLLALMSGQFHGVLAVLSVVVLAVLGFALRDNLLTVQIRRRQSRMLAEFPTVAEMIALAVSAGESAPGAFERVSRVSQGELNVELTRVLHQTQAGSPFSQALKEMSLRVQSAPISRFLEGIIVAMDRGTPLAEVMRAQAEDVRDLSKRDLMETAGKKEISMLIPLVFGVLPLTVIFAVYPGLELLSIGV
ncbi:type II secretion system F family protein [Nesterenkonia suensis]